MSLRSKDERNLEKKRIQQLEEMATLQRPVNVDGQDEYLIDKITNGRGNGTTKLKSKERNLKMKRCRRDSTLSECRGNSVIRG
jgi:hypothetical protein